ncbi:MAG: hypothetical protein HKN70_05935 [Gammaproteobacteria bacterium]|nr:hypothetical protein [Gammaproteobacteria bacterium]
MHVFEMVVLIVMIVGITTVLGKWLENRNESNLREEFFGSDTDLDENGMPLSLKRIEQLEERVAVLEKIVTDRNYDLKREFERL